MKILLITGFFPPYCPAATTRAPSFARFLLSEGHDVRVLCPRISHYKPVLQPGFSSSRIHYVDLPDIDAPTKWLKRFTVKLKGARNSQESQTVIPNNPTVYAPPLWRRILNQLYMEILHFPDRQWPWIKPALRQADKILASWKPDVIFVSSPPYSQVFAAQRLSRKYNIPWALEYRDTWVVQPYYNYSKARKWLEGRVERNVTKSADAIFCVTELAAKEIAVALDRPVLCARNGYDAEDFEGLADNRPLDVQKLTILYGGAIYGGKRDPSPLFKALKMLENAEQRFNVILYTDQQESVLEAVKELGVEQMVSIRGAIRREEFLKLELSCDILLLMRGPSADEDSVIPGKLFEYIGAARPILALGSTTGEAVDIVRAEKLGLVSNDAQEIAAQLEDWFQQKMSAGGQVPGPEVKDPQRYSRARQFTIIRDKLREIVASK